MQIKELIKVYLLWKQASAKIASGWAALSARFEIENLCFTARAREDSLGKKLSTALPTVAQREKKTLLVAAPDETISWLDCGAEYLLTTEDLFSILSAPVEKRIDFPQVFNTVENLYRRFFVVGRSSFAKRILNYLGENPNIAVEPLPLEALRAEKDGYLADCAVDADTLLIFGDLCPVRRVADRNGNNAIAMFAKLLFCAATDSVNGTDDTLNNIVPRLLDSGIPVLRVYMPSIHRLPHPKQLKASIFCWHVLRKLSEKAFAKARNRARGTAYLAENQSALTNDTSRGYSIMYGNGSYINFENGFRRTVGNTPDAAYTLHLFGPCFVRGLSTEDAETIPSLLQKRVPARYNVRNWGSEFGTCNYIMRETEFRAGDAVILFLLQTIDADDGSTPSFDMNITYRKIPNIVRHVDDDILHFDRVIQKQLVDDLYDVLMKNDMLRGANALSQPVAFGPPHKRPASIDLFCEDEGLKSYLSELRCTYPYAGQSRGAIVMNCNPFTCGHRYLIETAAKAVDELFVFIVQENRSFFPFEQRFQMVIAGTQDLKNVQVVPSGLYMISSKTLPGYFEKENLTSSAVDASDDLTYFVQLAAALHITVRFAGNEPNDPFTRRYNENMRRFLPNYGVQFCEIGRACYGENPISASSVRAAIQTNDFKTILQMVPETTLQHLIAYGYLKEIE